jgi:hypothetical protein
MNIKLIISLIFIFIITIIPIYISLKKDDYYQVEWPKTTSIIESIISTILIFMFTKYTITTNLFLSFISIIGIFTYNHNIINTGFPNISNYISNLIKSIICLIVTISPELLLNSLIDFNTMKIIITIMNFTIILNHILSTLHEIRHYFNYSVLFSHIATIISIFSIIILNTNITTSIAFITSLIINVIIYIITKYIHKKIKIK